MQENTEYDKEQSNLRSSRSDGLAGLGLSQVQEDLGYTPKAPANYSGVQDTRLLFDSGQQQGFTRPRFNLNESMNSMNLRQNRPPRSSPSPTGRSTRYTSPDRTNGFHQTSPTLIRKERQSFGPLDPQINPEIENAIISYCYIDLIDVLRYTKNTVNMEALREAMRRDILVWIDAFTMYMTIICSAHPIRVHDLLKYQRNIIWIYRETQDSTTWWRYDVAFRRKAELRQIQDWSYIDRDLFSMASSERARENFTCLPCLSNEHVLKKCPFGDGPRKSYPVIDVNGSPAANNEAIDRALANPEKLLKKPSEGLNLKFAFG